MTTLFKTMRIRTVLTTGCVLALTSIASLGWSASPASAENNVELKSGTGEVLRAKLYEHGGGGGHAISYYGSNSCSTTTTDNDYSKSSMPGWSYNSWNNQVSSWRDYRGCDLKFFDGENFAGDQTGWLNGGTGDARSMPNGWNDRVSSFRVS